MKQQESYKNAIKKQEDYIREMENYISLLEEENNLQKQLIAKLQEENSMLQKQYGDYTKAVHQMMNGLHL